MPREDTQFKKGQSGNPKGKGSGRPKGKSLRTILRGINGNEKIKLVDQQVIDEETGEVIKELSEYEALALRLYTIAKHGEDSDAMRAIGMIADRVEGKLTDKVEQKNEYVYPPEDDAIFERYHLKKARERLIEMPDDDINTLLKERQELIDA
jgi:hypothetical protein